MTISDICSTCGKWWKDCPGHSISSMESGVVYEVANDNTLVPRPLGAPNTVDMPVRVVYEPEKREIRFPHCDARIVHPPSECTFCDASGLQEVRACWGIAYTGQEPEGEQTPCPANEARSDESLYSWGGNRPVPPKEKV